MKLKKLLVLLVFIILTVISLAHGGRTDSMGGRKTEVD